MELHSSSDRGADGYKYIRNAKWRRLSSERCVSVLYSERVSGVGVHYYLEYGGRGQVPGGQRNASSSQQRKETASMLHKNGTQFVNLFSAARGIYLSCKQ
jgi:hypothetical protein